MEGLSGALDRRRAFTEKLRHFPPASTAAITGNLLAMIVELSQLIRILSILWATRDFAYGLLGFFKSSFHFKFLNVHFGLI